MPGNRSPWLLLLPGLIMLSVAAARADVQVTLAPGTQYQTILGWGASSWTPSWLTPAMREELIRDAVDDLGLTRLRVEPPGGNSPQTRRWEWFNDNGDPEDTNWAAFNTTVLDNTMNRFVVPFKQRVETNGEPFQFYVSPSFFDGGSTGSVPVWMFNSPGEYAEYATSLLLYIKNTYGLTADYYCILNEAGNGNPFWETAVAQMIKVLGPKLGPLGLTTRIQFPEAINANTSWGFINALRNDTAIWPYIGLLTYHLYGTNDPYRTRIRDFGLTRGIPTGQTEYMSLTPAILYDDLTLGGVSVWEIYGLSSQSFSYSYNRVQKNTQYWVFRQVLHYVRPGAVRIGATSDDANLKTLAFTKGPRNTVVLINGTGDRRAVITGLPAGDYTASQSIGTSPYQELGVRTVAAGGTLTIDVPSGAVLTVDSYSGVNLPPVPTTWHPSSGYLIQPNSSVTLSASATDPELDPVSYSWAVTAQPAGAAAALDTPNAPATNATNLTQPGDYVFTVTISDATHSVAREARVTVFTANQPPVPDDVHNRNPVLITLPQSSTTLRAGAWDMENDTRTYQWRIASQPSGAAAVLATPTTAACAASNMTVAGDYVFAVDISDPTHTVTQQHVVPVYPLNTAPQISAIGATPSPVKVPASTTTLSATTSDPDGDVITHWWSVKSAPTGASPVIASPSSPVTTVQRLSTLGNYVFTLTVIDRSLVTSTDVTVPVIRQPGDMDYDFDVDQVDFGLFQKCYSGVNIAVPSGCGDADLEKDNDVDLADFTLFQNCIGGANSPPRC